MSALMCCLAAADAGGSVMLQLMMLRRARTHLCQTSIHDVHHAINRQRRLRNIRREYHLTLPRLLCGLERLEL